MQQHSKYWMQQHMGQQPNHILSLTSNPVGFHEHTCR